MTEPQAFETRPHVVIVPGYSGSDADHWQSLWEAQLGDRAVRISPASWDEPELDDWLEAITRVTIPDSVLVAHSLGCLAVANWLARGGTARCAFLVAPPAPTAESYPEAAREFTVPQNALGVPALVVASSDDPYCSADAARSIAATWRVPIEFVGAAGHINAAASVGDWPQGHKLLRTLVSSS